MEERPTTDPRKLPETVTASIEPGAINAMARLFPSDPATVLSELFQNAWRAGATLVRVTIQAEQITIRDNGTGMITPAAVLTLARSDWMTDVWRRENPTGMGLFGLRGLHARIESHPAADTSKSPAWRIQTDPLVFQGQKSCAVEQLPENNREHGLQITIDRENGGNAWRNDRSIGTAAKAAALYSPVKVSVNGVNVTQIDFLKGAVKVVHWEGVRIGVFDHADANRPLLNCHGRTVSDCYLAEVVTKTTTWIARADVMAAPDLWTNRSLGPRMVVPNDFSRRLRAQCLHAIWRTLAATAEMAEQSRSSWWSGLQTDVTHATKKAAGKAGITLPDAARVLSKWRAPRANQWAVDDTPSPSAPRSSRPVGLLYDPLNERSAADQITLERACAHAKWKVYKADRFYNGYEWYERMPRLRQFVITIETLEGKKYTLEESRGVDQPPKGSRVKSIQVRTDIQRPGPNGKKEITTLTVDTDIAFWEATACSAPSARTAGVLVTEYSTIDPEALAALLMQGFFDGDPDDADNSLQVQAEKWYAATRYRATELLRSTGSAQLDEMRNTVEQHLIASVPAEKNATIRITGPATDRRIEIETSNHEN